MQPVKVSQYQLLFHTCSLCCRYRAVRCIRGDVNGEELEDEYCAAELQPSEVSNCSIVSTCPRWIPSEWSAVSSSLL